MEVDSLLPVTQNGTTNTHLMVSAQSGLKLPSQRFSQDESKCLKRRDWQGANVRHQDKNDLVGRPKSPLHHPEVWVPKEH